MASIIKSDNGVSSGITGIVQSADSSGQLALQTTTSGGTATTAVTIDNSQNVGVGVTPSAWGGSYKAMEVGGAALSLMGGTSGVIFGSVGVNWYFDGTNRIYKNTAAATYYNQANGIHYWFNAPSGTAGNAITFTQAMTLDASGNLGVGTTSPNIGGPNKAITLNSAASTNCSYELAVNNVLQGSFYSNVSTSSVNLGTFVNGPLTFITNSSERARIDSSGNLLVGTTSYGVPSGSSFQISPTYTLSGHVSGTASGQGYAYYYYNSNNIGSITQSGTTAVNFNGNSVPPSDQRLKTNIVDAPTAQSYINNIKVRSFDWIADNTHQTYGMIAQELMTVAPEVVPVHADENTMMGIDYAKLVPALIKCVQELSAQVTSLQATVETQATTIATLQNKIGA